MPTLTLGWRRLYDALGFSTSETGPISVSTDLFGGKHLSFYLGLEPPIGILSMNDGGYLIPGRSIEILRTDPAYKSDCFLEISITWHREISTEQEKQLAIENNELQKEILQEATTGLTDPESILV